MRETISAAAHSTTKEFGERMQYRKLGNSDLEISAISFGAWQLGDARFWGETDKTAATQAVHAALDAGVNLFDTAEMYGEGESERVLGPALGARRGDVYVASKVWPDNCRPADLRKACERSLKNLGTDYLDLYQIHWPIRDLPLADACETMTQLRDEGKIRYIGVSNFGPGDLGEWCAHADCVSNQVAYNLAFRAVEYEIVPDCAARNVGILAYMPVMQGFLAGVWDTVEDIPAVRRRTRQFSSEREGTRHGEPGCEAELFALLAGLRRVAEGLGTTMADVAIAWLIAQPGVTSAIVGARRPDQLKRNLGAASLVLPGDALAELDRVSLPVKEYVGANADLWNSGADSRIQ
jgi:aryl-alcohol dehydrogenase-like predicted oxidoreductase